MTLQTPADDAPHLAIGQLARRTGLTLKALRHYDRVGLLPPAHVDPATGHRYYAPAQLEVARLVHLLRSVDVPLDDVRTCVESGGDPTTVADVLATHRRRVEARSIRLRGHLHAIDHYLTDHPLTDPLTQEPTVTTTPATPATPTTSTTLQHRHEPRRREPRRRAAPTSRGRPVQRHVAPAGARRPHARRRRPDAAHGARVALPLGAGRHARQPGPRRVALLAGLRRPGPR
ncbi:MAG: MerR family transcriptional regulator [Angustibacter sp.]